MSLTSIQAPCTEWHSTLTTEDKRIDPEMAVKDFGQRTLSFAEIHWNVHTANLCNKYDESDLLLKIKTNNSVRNIWHIFFARLNMIFFTCQADNFRRRLRARRRPFYRQSTGLVLAPYSPQDKVRGNYPCYCSRPGKRRHSSIWNPDNWQGSWDKTAPPCCYQRRVLRCGESIPSQRCPHNRAPGSSRYGQTRGGCL